MLRSEEPVQGVVRINGKALDQSQLKKYDKNEKSLVTCLSLTHKGKTPQARASISVTQWLSRQSPKLRLCVCCLQTKQYRNPRASNQLSVCDGPSLYRAKPDLTNLQMNGNVSSYFSSFLQMKLHCFSTVKFLS